MYLSILKIITLKKNNIIKNICIFINNMTFILGVGKSSWRFSTMALKKRYELFPTPNIYFNI